MSIPPGPAQASPGPVSGQSRQSLHGPRHHGRRIGGSVRSAWPATGRAPRTRLARWLGHQVGALKPRPCAAHWKDAQRRCHLRSHHRAAAASMSAVASDPGSPRGSVAQIAAGTPPAVWGASASATELALPLQLVRSYEIPAGDPSYTGLLNWSWTYDSAVSAAAFAATGDKANSAQLLDQLAALQHTDGSIELALNVANGDVLWAEGSGEMRVGGERSDRTRALSTRASPPGPRSPPGASSARCRPTRPSPASPSASSTTSGRPPTRRPGRCSPRLPRLSLPRPCRPPPPWSAAGRRCAAATRSRPILKVGSRC